MQNVLWPALLTVGAGISVLIQQALNANLRSELNSAPWSGFMSYFLGVVCMVVLAAALRDPVPSASTISRVPLWAWSGGIFGAIFIGLSIITIPKLGGATYIALLVTGQMIAALAVDHFGWLGLQERPIDLPRMLGVALLIGGVVLIRRPAVCRRQVPSKAESERPSLKGLRLAIAPCCRRGGERADDRRVIDV
jgi:bacterial/archaeal transporter family-2 protein